MKVFISAVATIVIGAGLTGLICWRLARRSHGGSAAVSVVLGVAATLIIALVARPIELIWDDLLKDPLPRSQPAPPSITPSINPLPPTPTGNNPCPEDISSGLVLVTPKQVGGLTFCQVKINDGKLPITGPFSMSGQVLGTEEERPSLILLVQIDPSTRDTCGKRGGSGYFPIPDAKFDGLDGKWEYRDTLGDYLQGVTFGRKYSIASAPRAAIDELLKRRTEWNEDGIRSLPSSIKPLASFSVPPGEPNAAASCR